MFRAMVESTCFSDKAGDSVFPNIKKFNGNLYDAAFHSSMRAIFGDKIGESNRLHLYNYTNNVATLDCSNEKVWKGEFLNAFKNKINQANKSSLLVFTIAAPEGSTTETVNPSIALIDKHMSKLLPGFNTTETQAKWTASIESSIHEHDKSIYMRVFTNTNTNKTVVFIPNDVLPIRLLNSGLRHLIPWYSTGVEFGEDEINLLKSLLKDDGYDLFISSLENLESKYNFREVKIKSLLAGIGKIDIDKKVEKLNHQISERENTCDSYLRELSKIQAEIKKLKDLILGAYQRTTTVDQELINLFLSVKNLSLVDAKNERVIFDASTILNSYSESAVDVIYRNKTSWLYQKGDIGNNFKSRDELAQFFKAVFSDEKFKIKVCARFEMIVSDEAKLVATKGAAFKGYLADCLPNPHLNELSCLGQNKVEIAKCLKTDDYVSAIMQCLQATSNLAMGDDAACRRFVSTLDTFSGKCMIDENGNELTIEDALAIIKEAK